MLLYNVRLLEPTPHLGWVAWSGNTITEIGTDSPRANYPTDESINGEGLTLLPGFIDLHIHGSAGHDVMDATPEALIEISRFLARHGVTGWLPTTLTDSHPRLMAALQNIQAAGPNDGAAILGAHLEGPYLNRIMAGAQNPHHIRLASDYSQVIELLEVGVIKLVAVAPEFDENLWLIEECQRRGIVVSMAHTDATYAQAEYAVSLGLSQATHTYNAMRGLHHREAGALGAAMNLPDVFCELIADNIHVHPAAMSVLWRTKGAGRIILISDAVRPAGQPEGAYAWDERQIWVKEGAVRLEDGSLAGSVLTLNSALRNFAAAVHEPLETVWPTSSLNAARTLNLHHRKGHIAPEFDADLVLLDDSFDVQMTVVAGQIVYQK